MGVKSDRRFRNKNFDDFDTHSDLRFCKCKNAENRNYGVFSAFCSSLSIGIRNCIYRHQKTIVQTSERGKMKVVQNKSMNPNLKVIESEQESFRFKLERSDETWDVPLIQDLPIKQVRSLSKVADSDDGIDAIIDLFDELAPGLTDIATQRELSLVMEAWSDASNISVGE